MTIYIINSIIKFPYLQSHGTYSVVCAYLATEAWLRTTKYIYKYVEYLACPTDQIMYIWQ
jgi:hypothetical protein